MRLLNPLLALLGLLTICVTAAPTSSAVLATPYPTSSSYKTDLAAAITYARSAGPSPAIVKAAGAQCGSYSIVAGGFTFPTYATNFYCNETEQAEEMNMFWSWWCGFCVVFKDRQCQDDVRRSGGPEPQSPHDGHSVKGLRAILPLGL